jgi:hypothetical protein
MRQRLGELDPLRRRTDAADLAEEQVARAVDEELTDLVGARRLRRHTLQNFQALASRGWKSAWATPPSLPRRRFGANFQNERPRQEPRPSQGSNILRRSERCDWLLARPAEADEAEPRKAGKHHCPGRRLRNRCRRQSAVEAVVVQFGAVAYAAMAACELRPLKLTGGGLTVPS